MTENVKKGIRNYCVTVLFLLLSAGITQPQHMVDSNNSTSTREEINPYDKAQNTHIVSDFEDEEEDDNEEEE